MKRESNRSFPGSKNPDFQKEAKCKFFLVKTSIICMEIKNRHQINGLALSLALKQTLGATREWLINQATSYDVTHVKQWFLPRRTKLFHQPKKKGLTGAHYTTQRTKRLSFPSKTALTFNCTKFSPNFSRKRKKLSGQNIRVLSAGSFHISNNYTPGTFRFFYDIFR